MIKRLIAALCLALLMAGGITGPAQAASIHNCPDDRVCLYQWLTYGAPSGDANPGWKSTFLNIWNHSGHCVNLTQPMAYWPNGTEVVDNSASLVINNATWSGAYYVSVYNWANCQSAGGIASWGLTRDTQEPDLRDVLLSASTNAYHDIYSISVQLGSCPPSGC